MIQLKLHLRAIQPLQTIIFLLLLVATVPALLPVQHAIDEYMDQLKQNTIASLEDTLNRSISYESISPSLLLYLEVRGVSIETFSPNGTNNVDIGKIRVYYDFLSILKGQMFSAVNEISLIDSSFSLDQVKDKELIEGVQNFLSPGTESASKVGREMQRDRGSSSFSFELPEDLKISGRNIHISYKSPDFSIEVSELFFTISNKEELLQLQAEGMSHLKLSSGVSFGETMFTSSHSRFELSGRYSDLREEISSRVSIQNFSSNLFNFSGLTLEIERSEEKISVRKIEDRSPWDLKVDYFPQAERVELQFAAEEFSPDQNISPEEDLYPYSPWLNSVVSGTAEFIYNLKSSTIDYSAQLDLKADNEFLPFPLHANTKVSGTKEYAVFDHLAVRSKKIDADYRGTVQIQEQFATGHLNVQKLIVGEETVRGSASVRGTRNSFSITSPSVNYASLELQNILLKGSLNSTEINFQLAAAHLSEETKAQSRNLSLEGNYVYRGNQFLELSVSAQKIPTKALKQEFLPERIKNVLTDTPLFITTEAYITTDFDRFSFSLLPFIVSGPNDTEIARGSVNGNNDRVQISSLSFRTDRYEADGEIELVHQSKNTYKFESSLSVNSVYYDLKGVFHQGTTLVVRGNYGLYFGVVLQPQFVAFSAKMDQLPLPLGDEGTSEISLQGRGIYRNRTNWNMQVNYLILRNIPQLAPGSRVELAGTMKPGSFQLNTLKYSDDVSSLTGNADINFDSLQPFTGNGWINLADDEEREIYRIVGRKEGTDVHANIQIEAAPLSRFPEVPVEGVVTAGVDITGSYQNPRIDFSINLDEGEFQDGPLLLETVGRYRNNQLQLNYIHGEYRSNLLQKAEARFDFDTGNFNIQGEYRGILSRNRTSANVDLTGYASDIRNPLELPHIVSSNLNADLSIEKIQLLGEERESWYISINREEGELRFRGGPEESLYGVYNESGSYRVTLSEPLPIQLEAQGNLSKDEFVSTIDNIFIDMSFMKIIGLEAVDFYSGVITGDLEITGAFNDPEFNGALDFRDMAGNVIFIAESVEPFNTRMEFEGKEARLLPVEIVTGGRDARLSGGFEFDRWTPVNLRIEVETLHSEGVHVIYKDPSSGLNVDGYVLGSFIFQQTMDANLIKGDLTARNCVITLEEKQTVDVTVDNPLIVDLNITTGKRVEFLWPRRNLPILQTFADTDQSINIYFESITETFRLNGKVSMKSGELYYFQRSFYIKEGMITFNEDENNFDPLLDVKAEIKEIDNTGTPVTISLIVENDPLSTFTPRFESQPALSTVEIANILGANIYTQFTGSQTDLTSALLLTGDIFSQFSVVRSFEQQMKDVFNLDLFSLRTQMIQNVIVERVLNQNITQDPESTGTVGRYLDNTTLFLGKYLGNDLFFEALLQIQQEPFSVGELQQDELNFTMEIGLEWKTPLFLLNFSISPDFIDPLDSIQNTSLGLSWDYSY